MNKSVTKFIKTVKRGFGKRSPEILLGIGIASGITATVLAVKATPKALELLTEKRYEKYGDTLKEDDSYDDMPELKPVEVVKTTSKLNLTYQFKKRNNRIAGTRITLPGKIMMVD